MISINDCNTGQTAALTGTGAPLSSSMLGASSAAGLGQSSNNRRHGGGGGSSSSSAGFEKYCLPWIRFQIRLLALQVPAGLLLLSQCVEDGDSSLRLLDAAADYEGGDAAGGGSRRMHNVDVSAARADIERLAAMDAVHAGAVLYQYAAVNQGQAGSVSGGGGGPPASFLSGLEEALPRRGRFL